MTVEHVLKESRSISSQELATEETSARERRLLSLCLLDLQNHLLQQKKAKYTHVTVFHLESRSRGVCMCVCVCVGGGGGGGGVGQVHAWSGSASTM